MNPPDLPLLARAFEELTPEEFKAHVRSLFRKADRKERSIRLKEAPKPFIAKLDRRGKFYFRLNRDPRWMSQAEVEEIALSLGLPLNVIWLKIFRGKKPVLVSTKEEQARIAQEIAAIPWGGE